MKKSRNIYETLLALFDPNVLVSWPFWHSGILEGNALLALWYSGREGKMFYLPPFPSLSFPSAHFYQRSTLVV